MGSAVLHFGVRDICVTSLVIALTAGSAWAQSSAAPSRQDLELPDTPQVQSPAVDVKVDRSANFRENCPFEGSGLTTNVNNVSFVSPNGAPIFEELAEALSDISAPTGQNPLSIVCDIRDAANNALRQKGWIATVQIPQQELQNSLRLDVVSARISEVRIVGDTGPYRSLVEKKLSKLQQLEPLNEKDAERILFDVNDIPGMDLRLALAPSGGQPGEVIGNLTVAYKPYAAYFNARNYNAVQTGRETGYARLEYYGLTGLSDMTYVGLQSTVDFEEQMIAQVGHEFGIGFKNIRLGADATLARSKPSVDSLDLEADAFLVNLRAKYPLMRTPQAIADVSIGFDYVDQATDVGGFSLSEDAIRSLYLRGELSGTNRALGATAPIVYDTFVELRQGINVLGATETGVNGLARTGDASASRPFGRADSFIARAGANVSASLGPIIGANVRSELQWVDNPLLNFDEYSIGNLSIGRGYDPGANSGDRAYGAALELTANVVRGSRPSVQAFGFYDVVNIENLDFGTPDPKRTLASVGGGVRVGLGSGVRAEVTYAKPLDRALFADEEKPADRIMFSITTKFPATFR